MLFSHGEAKKMKNVKLRVTAALLVLILAAGCAWGAEGDYLVKGDQVYRAEGGAQKLITDMEPHGRINTDAGIWSWLLVDPELSDAMKGSESGVYFFRGEDDAPAGFLPMKNAIACMLEFSPSGEKLLISNGNEAKQDLGYYVLEESGHFVKKAAFVSAGYVFWIDPHRFLFTVIDAKKGPRSKTGDDWWYSAALYDTVENELTVIKKATPVKNYIISGCDYEGGTMDITEGSVKIPGDWSKPGRIKYRELNVPIPAAG